MLERYIHTKKLQPWHIKVCTQTTKFMHIYITIIHLPLLTNSPLLFEVWQVLLLRSVRRIVPIRCVASIFFRYSEFVVINENPLMIEIVIVVGVSYSAYICVFDAYFLLCMYECMYWRSIHVRMLCMIRVSCRRLTIQPSYCVEKPVGHEWHVFYHFCPS